MSGCSTGGLKRFKLPLEAGLMKGVCAGVTYTDKDGVGAAQSTPRGGGFSKYLAWGSLSITDSDAEAGAWTASGLWAAPGRGVEDLTCPCCEKTKPFQELL